MTRNHSLSIPSDVIVRGYWRGLINLFEIFIPIVDAWALYDNIGETRLIANSEGIINEEIYYEIIRRMEEKDRLNLWEKLNKGLEKSYEKMLKEKVEKGQPIITSENGVPTQVSAYEALCRFYLDLKLRKDGYLK